MDRKLAVSASQNAATWYTSVLVRVWPGLLKVPEVPGASSFFMGAPQNQHRSPVHTGVMELVHIVGAREN